MAPKREFYEDDEVTTTEPGLNKKISDDLKAKESIQLGKDVTMFNGMTIRAPEFANKYLKQARLYAYNKLVLIENEFSTSVSAVKNEAAIIKDTYSHIVAEPALPGLIYILTGSLSGSILVRNRALPIRFITPLIFGGVVFGATMPKTFDNTAKIISQYEQKWPELYETHKAVNQNARELYAQSIAFKKDANNDLIQNVAKARKFVKDLLNGK